MVNNMRSRAIHRCIPMAVLLKNVFFNALFCDDCKMKGVISLTGSIRILMLRLPIAGSTMVLTISDGTRVSKGGLATLYFLQIHYRFSGSAKVNSKIMTH